MKNKKIIISVIIMFTLMLIPIQTRLKDGESMEYKAFLYSITKYHKLNEKSLNEYSDGWKIKILGYKVYDKIYNDIEEQEKDNITAGESEVIESECCVGCLCGDTLELLKNVETAWISTVIDSTGKYIYNNNTFINFHGTGKNKFAYFETSKSGRTIKEIKGELFINNKDEIILIPSDKKRKNITCKIGEEKNLIAILECNNDFGTFTLQKQGLLHLSNEIKESLFKTKSILIKYKQGNQNTKRINDINQIEKFVSILETSKIWTGAITLPSPLYEIELFDSNNKSVALIKYNPKHYFTFNVNDSSYNLIDFDDDLLINLVNK